MSDCKDIAEIIADYRLHDRENGLLNIKKTRIMWNDGLSNFPKIKILF